MEYMNKLVLLTLLSLIWQIAAYPQSTAGSTTIQNFSAKKTQQEPSASATRTNKKTNKSKAVNIDSVYNEAVSLYAKKRYQESLSRFMHIESIQPEYKQTSFYIKNIPEVLAEKENQKILEKVERKEVKLLYKKAVRLYKKKLFEESLKVFKEIDSKLPGYAKTSRYIKKINSLNEENNAKKYKKQDNSKNLAFLYKDALSFYKRKHYEEALVLFKAIEEQSPKYKNTQSYIDRISSLMEKNIEKRVKESNRARIKSMHDFLRKLEKENH
jgi:outer membrane protein assembly factor BamD (BamD/ComL family)